MFGIKEIRDRVDALLRAIDRASVKADNDVKCLRNDVIIELRKKNKEIDNLNRKVDTLLDYLGLKYSPEIVHIDCIEEIETDNQKGKK
jgi:hypothetical protein